MNTKFFAVIAGFVFAAVAASAQNNTNDTIPGNEVRQVATPADIQDYKKDFQEAFNGRPNDEVVAVVNDRVFWRGATTQGFSASLRGGFGADFGGGVQTYQPQASLTVGYTGGVFDVDISAGFNKLADQDGKAYFALNTFFEPKWNFVHWGKNNLKTNKLFFGPKLGLQESRDMNFVYYEDENIVLTGNGNDRSMGFAYGFTFGYERRFFMSPIHVGVMLDCHTYDTQSNFRFTMNGETLRNEVKKSQRFYIGVTLYVEGFLQKVAQNF